MRMVQQWYEAKIAADAAQNAAQNGQHTVPEPAGPMTGIDDMMLDDFDYMNDANCEYWRLPFLEVHTI